MKNILLIFLFLLYSTLIFCQPGDTIKVMTFNIRCQSGEKEDDINYWGSRKYLVAEVIEKYNPGIIGMQEAEKRQIDDLENLLENHNWIGVGRDDGKSAGEFSPIFYDSTKYEAQWDSTFWLSPTPHIPSKGWDAMLNRIATFALFKNKEDGKEFYFFNTHFDHIGDTARVESAKLIIKKIKEIPANFPVILSGDFNITSDSEPYKILTGEKLPDGNPVLYDAQFISSTPHSGGMNSFNGFGKTEEPDRKIDFIFVSNRITVSSHGIIKDKINGLYSSDHFPVLAVVQIH